MQGEGRGSWECRGWWQLLGQCLEPLNLQVLRVSLWDGGNRVSLTEVRQKVWGKDLRGKGPWSVSAEEVQGLLQRMLHSYGGGVTAVSWVTPAYTVTTVFSFVILTKGL